MRPFKVSFDGGDRSDVQARYNFMPSDGAVEETPLSSPQPKEETTALVLDQVMRRRRAVRARTILYNAMSLVSRVKWANEVEMQARLPARDLHHSIFRSSSNRVASKGGQKGIGWSRSLSDRGARPGHGNHVSMLLLWKCRTRLVSGDLNTT